MDFEAPRPADLLARYRAIRALTHRLIEPLTAEDMLVQSMPSASPTKWHLAHTTWFFETFVLQETADYCLFDPEFNYLFNSYYNTIGDRISRLSRGLLSRPTLDTVLAYRRHVDAAMERLLAADAPARLLQFTEIGLHHEQQHQELILTDVKHALGSHPLLPAYRAGTKPEARAEGPRGAAEPNPSLGSRLGLRSSARASGLEFSGGLVAIGHDGPAFAYDNETPRHTVYLHPFRLAARPVTCGEYLAFVNDDGYRRPELWLSDGWDAVRQHCWDAPLYWEKTDGQWHLYTLDGLRPVRVEEPVVHVSYYEAEAFARWANARLPTEAEWEAVARQQPLTGSFLDADHLHPVAAQDVQWFGEVWQWTASAYLNYPGYRRPPGALGEYNAKFTCNQFVLRGGSCATPRSHFRTTYRNFFPPEARWQFTGLRLAEDL